MLLKRGWGELTNKFVSGKKNAVKDDRVGK